MKSCLLSVAVLLVVIVSAPSAQAIKEYGDVFNELYVDADENPDFAKLVKKSKCWLCHQGRKRKNNNRYGMQMEGKLNHDEDKEDTEKIANVLREVAELPVDQEDEEGDTFGDLIARGELPGGSLEDVRKEPPESDDEEEEDDEDEDDDA